MQTLPLLKDSLHLEPVQMQYILFNNAHHVASSISFNAKLLLFTILSRTCQQIIAFNKGQQSLSGNHSSFPRRVKSPDAASRQFLLTEIKFTWARGETLGLTPPSRSICATVHETLSSLKTLAWISVRNTQHYHQLLKF